MRHKHSHRYFENRNCRYFPCHTNIRHEAEGFNCLFCYCPLYHLPDCGGNPRYKGDVKDCGECGFPHAYDNYDAVLDRLKTARHASGK